MQNQLPTTVRLFTRRPQTSLSPLGKIALVAGASLACALPAHAVGFRLPNQDPEAIARGNAFAATADNPSAIYHNPAGITQLEGHQIRVGLYMISTGVEHTSPTGVKSEPDDKFQPVPQLYYVFSPKESDLSFGLGVYAPYGLAIDWGENTPFATRGVEGHLTYITVNPVIAWQVSETLSLAIGPHINYSDAELIQNLGAPGSNYRFHGDDVGYSFGAGLRWQPHEQWAFGVNYKYMNELEYEGSAAVVGAFSLPGRGSLRFPQSVEVGVSYRPTPNWNFEINVDWTDWDYVNSIEFYEPTPSTLPLDYKSSLMYEFGITRKLTEHYYLSTGYIFSENSSPDAGFTPLIPDSDLHLGSIGLSRRGERWDWAVGYHFAYNSGRTVTGSQTSLFGETADGTYETLNHAFNIAATFKF